MTALVRARWWGVGRGFQRGAGASRAEPDDDDVSLQITGLRHPGSLVAWLTRSLAGQNCNVFYYDRMTRAPAHLGSDLMIDFDDPERIRRRRLASAGFTARRVRAMEDQIRPTATALM
jgi:hypothetical protein